MLSTAKDTQTLTSLACIASLPSTISIGRTLRVAVLSCRSCSICEVACSCRCPLHRRHHDRGRKRRVAWIAVCALMRRLEMDSTAHDHAVCTLAILLRNGSAADGRQSLWSTSQHGAAVTFKAIASAWRRSNRCTYPTAKACLTG